MIKLTKTLLLLFTIIFGLSSCSNSVSKNKNSVTQKITSLQKSYKDNFYIGAAINDGQINGSDTLALNVIKREFNTISPENIMKWMYLQPEKGVFDFEMTDKYVALGEKNNMFIVPLDHERRCRRYLCRAERTG